MSQDTILTEIFNEFKSGENVTWGWFRRLTMKQILTMNSGSSYYRELEEIIQQEIIDELMLFLTLTHKTDQRINMKLSSFNNQLQLSQLT